MNFLHTLKICVTLIVITLFTVSCTEEQSSLNISDIEGKAQIIGNISYSTGTELLNGEYKNNMRAANNVKVLVKISNQSLDPKHAANGYTIYETTTDFNGDYKIEVPAVENDGQGTTVIIAPESFLGKYSITTYNKRETQNGIFETNISEGTVRVLPNDLKVVDLTYRFTKRKTEY